MQQAPDPLSPVWVYLFDGLDRLYYLNQKYKNKDDGMAHAKYGMGSCNKNSFLLCYSITLKTHFLCQALKLYSNLRVFYKNSYLITFKYF